MKVIKTATYEKLAQIPNPLDGKPRQSARGYLYKLIGDLTQGIHSDNYWAGVQQIWKVWKEAGIDWQLSKNPQYFKDDKGRPNKKEWYFKVSFLNNRQVPTEINGTLTAFGAGSVEDPLSSYDITVTMY